MCSTKSADIWTGNKMNPDMNQNEEKAMSNTDFNIDLTETFEHLPKAPEDAIAQFKD